MDLEPLCSLGAPAAPLKLSGAKRCRSCISEMNQFAMAMRRFYLMHALGALARPISRNKSTAASPKGVATQTVILIGARAQPPTAARARVG